MEINLAYRVSDQFSVHGSTGYSDAHYGAFPNSQCWVGQTVAEGCVAGVQRRAVHQRLVEHLVGVHREPLRGKAVVGGRDGGRIAAEERPGEGELGVGCVVNAAQISLTDGDTAGRAAPGADGVVEFRNDVVARVWIAVHVGRRDQRHELM